MNNSFKLCLIVLLLSLTCGCKIYLKDLTSEFQPAWGNTKTHDVFYLASKAEVRDASQSLNHYFFLEIKPQRVHRIQPTVIINGNAHAMSEVRGTDGAGVWLLKLDNMCSSTYDYYYTVTYKNNHSQAEKVKKLGGPDNVFHSEVTDWGSLIWVQKYGKPSPYRTGNEVELYFREGGSSMYETDIYLQNLSPTRKFKVTHAAVIQNEEKFEIYDPVNIGQELLCGHNITFGVRWKRDYSHPTTDFGALVIDYQYWNNGGWVNTEEPFVINLKGYDKPPVMMP